VSATKTDAASGPPSASVAVYRGRFDPPGLHHIDVIHALLRRFVRVFVVPWGAVNDRAADENVASVYRARLIDLAFSRLGPRVTVDLRDVEHLSSTSSQTLAVELAMSGESATFVVESDGIAEDRARLHDGAPFVVVAPEGVAVPGIEEDRVIRVDKDVQGRVMRERAFSGKDVEALVPPAVAADIRRRGLYRSIEPRNQTRLRFPAGSKVFVSMDERNPRAHELRARLGDLVTTDIAEAAAIVVIGGDGSMLHAIQTHWRRRLPYIGLNAGHLGFLLNDASTALPTPKDGDADDAAGRLLSSELIVHHMPMLFVELQKKDGTWVSGLTFNDAWVERASGQSAWVEVKVDDHVRIEKLICDGVLVSTAAGSTAYARSMGASPLLADTPAWLIVGSNVMDPLSWKSALLAKNSVVEIRSLHIEKRPLAGYLHSVSMGEVVVMRARLSRAASAELCFLGLNDLTEKIARVQFIAAR